MATEKKRPAEAPNRLDQMLDAADAAYVQGGEPSTPPAQGGGLGWDPVTAAVEYIRQHSTKLEPGATMIPGLPAWLQPKPFIDVIPQNMPEAAVTALSIPTGGAGSVAMKWAPAIAQHLGRKGLTALAERSGLTGLATSAAGYLTGHDPLESFKVGAYGRPVGEALGKAGGAIADVTKKIKESRLAKEVSGAVTKKVADTLRTLIPDWLSTGASDKAVIGEVVTDRAAKAVGAKLNDLKAQLAQAKTSVQAIDLQDGLQTLFKKAGIKFEWPAMWRPAGPGVPKPGEVELVPLWNAIDAARKRLGSTQEDFAADQALKAARETLVQRANVPELTRLVGEYAKTKILQSVFPDATAAREFINPDGTISPQGASGIYERLTRLLPQLERQKTFTPDELSLLKGAFNWQPEAGLGYPTTGWSPKVGITVGASGPKPTVSVSGSPLKTHPGVTVPATTAVEKLAGRAVGALGGAKATEEFAGTPTASAEEAPPLTGPVYVPPAKFKDAYALGITPPAAVAPPVVAPPPVPALKRPSPEASAPQAGTQGKSWFPSFDKTDEDEQPEVTLEVTKKPGE